MDEEKDREREREGGGRCGYCEIIIAAPVESKSGVAGIKVSEKANL